MARIVEASAPLARLVKARRMLVAPDGTAEAQVRAVVVVVAEEARAGAALPPANEVPPRMSPSLLDFPPKTPRAPRIRTLFCVDPLLTSSPAFRLHPFVVPPSLFGLFLPERHSSPFRLATLGARSEQVGNICT